MLCRAKFTLGCTYLWKGGPFTSTHTSAYTTSDDVRRLPSSPVPAALVIVLAAAGVVVVVVVVVVIMALRSD
jgi:hypothetical protein